MIRSSSPSVAMYSEQRKPSSCQNANVSSTFGRVQVEVVEAHDRRPAMGSKRCSCVGNCSISWKNSSGNPNGSQHPHGAPHAEVVAVHPAHEAPAALEVRRHEVEIGVRPHAERQAHGAADRRPAAGRASGAVAPPSRADTACPPCARSPPARARRRRSVRTPPGRRRPARRTRRGRCRTRSPPARSRSARRRGSSPSHLLAVSRARQDRAAGRRACRARRGRSRSRSRSRTRSPRPRGRCRTALTPPNGVRGHGRSAS